MEKPLLRDYTSASQYLQDYYLYRKNLNVGFSYQQWSKEIGIPNRSYLRLITAGHRPLNESLLRKLLPSLGLSVADQTYFQVLVQYTQSKTQEQRRVFGLELAKLLGSEVEQAEIVGHFQFLSNPLMPKLQTLLGFADFPKSISQIAGALELPECDVQQALMQLESMGLAKKESESSGWIASQRSWKVSDQFKDLGLKEFYRLTFKKAESAIDLPIAERRFRSLFVAMNADEYQEFLGDFEIFVREQLRKRNVDTITNRRLYQLNFNFFAETKGL